ncbi:MAG: hypothetical protein E5V36_00820 [Mesorhizobium sp.]|nr:MAG: hypothetical protein E5V36_00820 [Mesorhizobium sp.]
MTLSFVGVLAYRWFGPVALVVVAGIGLSAVLAFSAYRFDLKKRHKVSNFDPSFLIGCLICGGIFFAFVFIQSRWLREHTKDWVPCAAEVLDRLNAVTAPIATC